MSWFASGWIMDALAWSEAAAEVLSLLRTLAVSSALLDSYRVRSAALLDRKVSPWIFSLAIESEADALGGRGQEPYQLEALRTLTE